MKKLKYVKLFENFSVNESEGYGGGPTKVLYCYVDDQGKNKKSTTSFKYYKETGKNGENAVMKRLKGALEIHPKCLDYIPSRHSILLDYAKGTHYPTGYTVEGFYNTHQGAPLLERILDSRGNPVDFMAPECVYGWFSGKFYDVGLSDNYSMKNFGQGKWINEEELDLLIKTNDIQKPNDLKHALDYSKNGWKEGHKFSIMSAEKCKDLTWEKNQ